MKSTTFDLLIYFIFVAFNLDRVENVSIYFLGGIGKT